MPIRIKFLGAAGTVTGSKHLVEAGGRRLLLDAGLFQGAYDWRRKNWAEFDSYAGIKAKNLDAVVLSHAHLDHTGLLPKLYREGLRAPIYCSQATKALCEILLPDAGKIQEEDTNFRRKKKLSRYDPPVPLYTQADALAVLKQFRHLPLGRHKKLSSRLQVTLRPIGHILGAASITIDAEGKRLTFSGDVGRYNVPILRDPEPCKFGELLVIESTYGSRRHSANDLKEQLARVINATYQRSGAVIIPSFAIDRTQLLLYYLRECKEQGLIPDLPVYVDSPMATDATEIYRHGQEYFNAEAQEVISDGRRPFVFPNLHFVRNQEESKALNHRKDPLIVISAGGMLEGGRVLHHLFHRITGAQNTILLSGFQAEGTKGAYLQGRPKYLKLFKQQLTIKAQVEALEGISGHGDRDELLRWIRESVDRYGKVPKRIVVVHGAPEASRSLARLLRKEIKTTVYVPKYLRTLHIDD